MHIQSTARTYDPWIQVRHDEDKISYLQIRGNYLAQAIKQKTKKGTRDFVKDRIISYLILNKNLGFQFIREFQDQLEPLPLVIGIKIYSRIQNNLICELIATQYEKRQQKLEDFGRALQKNIIVQNCFHKLFKPIKKLGKGATSLVIQGYSIRDRKSYAIKGFKKSKGYSVENGIFSKQYDILRQIKHKNIIELHSIHQSQNSLYMVFDKYDLNLLDYLNYRGIKTQEQLKCIIKGVLEALQYLHQKGIMHRDVKLQNIMIKEVQCKQVSNQHNQNDDQTKTIISPILIDFGFAQYDQSDEFLLHRCGTPGYVAPQILQNYKNSASIRDSFNCQTSQSKKKYNRLCDIFSLGCVFHIILTKKMVFQGSTKQEVMKNNALCKIDNQSLQYKTLDIVARKLMFKMLQIDINKRISASSALKDQFFSLVMFNFKPLQYKFFQTVCSSKEIKQRKK